MIKETKCYTKDTTDTKTFGAVSVTSFVCFVFFVLN
jgi:hypothetical protein